MSYYGRDYYDKYFQTKGIKALADLDKPLYHDNFVYKLFHHKELRAEYEFINTHLRRHYPSINELHMEVHGLILSKEFRAYGNIYGLNAENRLRLRFKLMQHSWDARNCKPISHISIGGIY
jgi:hypothetical protein